MGIDKRRARKNAFRIPEATLFSIAIIGGSLGSILGMFFFRHKTKHWYFILGLPLILLIQIPLGVGIYTGGAHLLKLDSFDYLTDTVRNLISRRKAE